VSELFTVVGAQGFLGAALVQQLKQDGHTVIQITRENWPELGARLGHVIFAAGKTTQFAQRPIETVQSQTSLPASILADYNYSSFLYISSTRVYRTANSTHEGATLSVAPGSSDEIYNLTKLTAECMCLALENPFVRVVRLANIFAPFSNANNFLASILNDAARARHINFKSGPETEKDYVDLRVVLELLPKISLSGQKRLYNLASGQNTSHKQIAEKLEQLGISTQFEPSATIDKYLPIDVSLLHSEFDVPNYQLIEELPHLLKHANQIATDKGLKT